MSGFSDLNNLGKSLQAYRAQQHKGIGWDGKEDVHNLTFITLPTLSSDGHTIAYGIMIKNVGEKDNAIEAVGYILKVKYDEVVDPKEGTTYTIYSVEYICNDNDITDFVVSLFKTGNEEMGQNPDLYSAIKNTTLNIFGYIDN